MNCEGEYCNHELIDVDEPRWDIDSSITGEKWYFRTSAITGKKICADCASLEWY